MTKTEIRDLPIQTRLAQFAPATMQPEARTVEVTWTTGAKVRRRDWWTGQSYDEELSLSEGEVDLSRLNNGAPLLNSHDAFDLANVLGVVEKAWIEGGEGRALVRFSDRAEVAPIVADVAAGIIRNISVGYAVRKYQVTEGDIPLYRAIDWQPMELSLVAIPADAGAGTRQAARTGQCEFLTETRATAPFPQEGKMMSDHTDAAVAAASASAAIIAESVATERTRISEITKLCARHAVPDLVPDLVEIGATVDQARAAILDAMATRDEAVTTRPRAPVVEAGRQDETETRRSGMENAILNKALPGNFKLAEIGRQFRGMDLIDIARDTLEARGIRTRGMVPMDIASRAFETTSDFPNILANVANKTLRMAYEAAPQTFRPFTRQMTAPDFKPISRTALGDAPALKQINEQGEYTYGSISDGAETYQLASYGRIIAITRQAIINDDLGAFSRLSMMIGRAAANLESDVVWGIITANAALSDGVALFYSTHGNLAGSGGAISVTTLDAGRSAMRVQKSLDGQYMNLSPAFLLVPAAKETLANQYTSAEFVSTKPADINPFRGSLQVIVEPRLDGSSTTAWYLAADPAQIDTIEYSYLEGNEGVYIENRIGFEVDGIEIKARLDFAAKAIDFRGLYKNAGA